MVLCEEGLSIVDKAFRRATLSGEKKERYMRTGTPGKLIGIFGTNNLGKTTQAQMLVKRMNAEHRVAIYRKYGLYGLEPSGPVLDGYLRRGNPHNLSPREFQLVHILNRTQADNELRDLLRQGVNVVVEDYCETGIAWGTGAGVDKEFLERMNSHLARVDFGILFDGERFLESKEHGHRHEEDEALMKKVRDVHRVLARERGWAKVNPNRCREDVHADLWHLLSEFL